MAEDGDLGGSEAQYDVWGRPVTSPAREAAEDAAENAAPLLVARNSPQRSQEEREAEIAQARAEQRAWWDAELERARKETQGGPRPVRLSIFCHLRGPRRANEHHSRLSLAPDKESFVCTSPTSAAPAKCLLSISKHRQSLVQSKRMQPSLMPWHFELQKVLVDSWPEAVLGL